MYLQYTIIDIFSILSLYFNRSTVLWLWSAHYFSACRSGSNPEAVRDRGGFSTKPEIMSDFAHSYSNHTQLQSQQLQPWYNLSLPTCCINNFWTNYKEGISIHKRTTHIDFIVSQSFI